MWPVLNMCFFINSLGKKEQPFVSLFSVSHRNQFTTISIMRMKTNHIWRCSRPTWTWLSGDPLHRALRSLLWCRLALAHGRCGVWTALRACRHELHRSPCTERHWETRSSWFRLDEAALQKNVSLKDIDRKRNLDMRGSLNKFLVYFWYHEASVVPWIIRNRTAVLWHQAVIFRTQNL